jgi:hypothetical protein
LLDAILAGVSWSDELLRRAVSEEGGRPFFSVVVERLADLFEPRLCDAYVKMFSRVMEMVSPRFRAAELISRYERIRRVRRCARRDVREVFVLSRVTLGADVAVTSVLLDALRRRFPEAVISLVGPGKNWELFANSGIRHASVSYPRSGHLRERLSHTPSFSSPECIVVDPDSRLSQLGILPVCPEENYYFFESRAYGGVGGDPLPVLASRWAAEVFDIGGRAWIAPERASMPCDVAVSFGVGANEEKRVPDPFEENLLRSLCDRGLSVMVDTGAGGQEKERIEQLRSRMPEIRTFHGPYAPFASMISQAKLYIGYDSAGQHVAAACGIPLVSIFAGYPSDRMFQRWRPHGSGRAEVIQVRGCDFSALIAQASAAVDRLLSQRGGK